uniref:DUF4536 domain-containing protein n=1 Tax=Bicosoecida sp. CB-2014 TaxID=1486930 RepID=A0A7S1CRG2_9STRA
MEAAATGRRRQARPPLPPLALALVAPRRVVALSVSDVGGTTGGSGSGAFGPARTAADQGSVPTGAAPAAAEPSSATAAAEATMRLASVGDCLTCRVTGTVGFLGCAAYVAWSIREVPKANVAHRATGFAMAGAFAAVGVYRALMP